MAKLIPMWNNLFVKKVVEEKTVGGFEVPPSNTSFIRCEVTADCTREPVSAKYVLIQKQFLNLEIEPDTFLVRTFDIDAKEVDEITEDAI